METVARPGFNHIGTPQTLVAGGIGDKFILNLIQSFSMRILGWLLLIGGLLLCVSILWAAPGFFCMGLGLIFLQIAERKRRKAKSTASPSDQYEPQVEQAPLPEATRAVLAPQADAGALAAPENVTGLYAYDRQKWRALRRSDPDISRLAKVLEAYGQKYLDEFAAAYLALNDKDYLPMILRQIVASARRDSGQDIDGDSHEDSTNPDAVAMAFERTSRSDGVRETRSGCAEQSASVDNAATIDPGPEEERVSQSSGRQFGAGADRSAAREAAAEEANLKSVGADEDSNVSTAPLAAVEATASTPPEVREAAAEPDEKKPTREVDAVDANNLTEILDRLSEVLVPKTK